MEMVIWRCGDEDEDEDEGKEEDDNDGKFDHYRCRGLHC